MCPRPFAFNQQYQIPKKYQIATKKVQIHTIDFAPKQAQKRRNPPKWCPEGALCNGSTEFHGSLEKRFRIRPEGTTSKKRGAEAFSTWVWEMLRKMDGKNDENPDGKMDKNWRSDFPGENPACLGSEYCFAHTLSHPKRR